MLEFKVGKFVTLKLEDGKTNIYVNGKLFNQCKYILLERKTYDAEDLYEIDSVDELAEYLTNNEEKVKSIPEEIAFWAHCSNLQTWVENNYDCRLLHRNLAFPLLKKLTELGDIKASRIFKDEIAKRIESEYLPVIDYLVIEGYFFHFSTSEIKIVIENLSKKSLDQIKISLLNILKQNVNNNHLKEKIYQTLKLVMPKSEFDKIKFVTYRKEKYFPFDNELAISRGIANIKRIRGLKDLVNLKGLHLIDNKIKRINGLSTLVNLNILNLSKNKITKIKGLNNLLNLEILYLDYNNIKKIEGVEKLVKLKRLNLIKNKISKIEGIENLENLQFLIITQNKISKVEELENLKKLQYLGIDNNIQSKFNK